MGDGSREISSDQTQTSLVFQVKFKRKLRRHRKSISTALSGLVGSIGFVIWRGNLPPRQCDAILKRSIMVTLLTKHGNGKPTICSINFPAIYQAPITVGISRPAMFWMYHDVLSISHYKLSKPYFLLVKPSFFRPRVAGHNASAPFNGRPVRSTWRPPARPRPSRALPASWAPNGRGIYLSILSNLTLAHLTLSCPIWLIFPILSDLIYIIYLLYLLLYQ